MHVTFTRLVVVAATAILTLAVQVTAASAGGGFGTGPADILDPPLTQHAAFTLSGGTGGAIEVVVYEGNELAIFSSVSTTLTGFTVPASPFRAKTTFVVADGQCGARSPNGCAGVQTAGGADTLSFSAGGGGLTDGPDAFKGSDGCPWGADTCLWDTRTFDVTSTMAPGDTSAVATMTAGSNADGADCISHQVQVLAVGPDAAWSRAGYVATGRGLRNQSSGGLVVAGVPAGATVKKALLYWNVLNPSDPGGAMTFNGVNTPGSLVKPGGDPCWDGGSWAFRSDVTAQVSGNGVYTVSGFPSGSPTGADPWSGSSTPMMEGASVLVFYESAPGFDVSYSAFIPHDHVIGPPQARCGFVQQLYFAGDARGFSSTATSFRGRQRVSVVTDDADGIKDETSPQNLVGESRSYAPDALADGRIDSADDDAVLGDCHLLHARGTASTSSMHITVTPVSAKVVRVRLFGGTSNPLLISPNIDWDLTLTIDASSLPTSWTLTGAHDGFPAHEVYVNGQTLYTYDPGAPPYSFVPHLIRLFPPLEVSVSRNGTLD